MLFTSHNGRKLETEPVHLLPSLLRSRVQLVTSLHSARQFISQWFMLIVMCSTGDVTSFRARRSCSQSLVQLLTSPLSAHAVHAPRHWHPLTHSRKCALHVYLNVGSRFIRLRIVSTFVLCQSSVLNNQKIDFDSDFLFFCHTVLSC